MHDRGHDHPPEERDVDAAAATAWLRSFFPHDPPLPTYWLTVRSMFEQGRSVERRGRHPDGSRYAVQVSPVR